MALATEALLNLLHKQVEDHSTVVWFDPEKSYLDLARTLEPDAVAGAAVHRYDPERGFVWLRRQLERSGKSAPTRPGWSSTCLWPRPRRTTRWSSSRSPAPWCGRASSLRSRTRLSPPSPATRWGWCSHRQPWRRSWSRSRPGSVYTAALTDSDKVALHRIEVGRMSR